MSDDQQQTQTQFAAHRELSAQQEGDRLGMQTQHSEVSKRKYNPGFYKEISHSDLDTDKYPWIENELGAKSSSAHILGNRPRHYVAQQELLNRNHAERMIAEREPGRLLKKNPIVNVVWQGVEGEDDVDYVAPIRHSEERRQYRDAAEVLTTRESLAVEGKGLDSLTTASTETRVRKDNDEEASASARKLGKLFGRGN